MEALYKGFAIIGIRIDRAGGAAGRSDKIAVTRLQRNRLKSQLINRRKVN